MKEWWTPDELAALALPEFPTTREAIARRADRENWRQPSREYPANPLGVWRRREGRGGGYEYRYDLLPLAARTILVLRQQRAEGRDARAERAAAKATLSREERWAWFEKLPENKKQKARSKLEALLAVDALTMAGTKRDDAMVLIASQIRVTLRTLYNWAGEVAGIERQNWLAFLAPRHAGGQAQAECDPAAWEWIKAAWLTQSKPTAAHCYRQLQGVAKAQGWTIPSCKTLERRLATIDQTTRTFFREGPEALKRLYPAQQRDRTALHALEAVNADGHKWDVFVRWPDGEIGRPCMVGFQDLFSGMILSWRVDRSENKEAVRLAFGDIVETYGIPDHCLFDNGRNFASKWLTGGTETRYRFKVRDEDPVGLLPELGCQVHWATPYHGQAKPIERAWRDFAQNIARDPRFVGAWTGNTVAAKPENYASKAIPLESFLAVVSEGIAEHNTRAGRRTDACAGRLSFAEAFAVSYQQSPIRQATPEQQRRWLLASELTTARRPDGSVHLYGNRYWCEALLEHLGRKVVARFDPDALHESVHLYRPDGAYIAAAQCVERTGFFDSAAARVHARARNDFLKAAKAMAKAERKLSLDDLAALMPTVEAPEAPETKVVRPVFGTAGNAALRADPDMEHDQDSVLADFGRAMRQLRVVRDNDGADG
ncbi:transposase domain-containing protein [Azorhizobium doebereinerae]|uniref:transposase domain-containing protein n=1 Tax=Azorhizobium doebereinerae TaxID=281091 RepID=UPI0003FD5CBB|nr:transposase domain-containing protein [Azorhizobium doebereinerae]